jgi:hypothetical protein
VELLPSDTLTCDSPLDTLELCIELFYSILLCLIPHYLARTTPANSVLCSDLRTDSGLLCTPCLVTGPTRWLGEICRPQKKKASDISAADAMTSPMTSGEVRTNVLLRLPHSGHGRMKISLGMKGDVTIKRLMEECINASNESIDPHSIEVVMVEPVRSLLNDDRVRSLPL